MGERVTWNARLALFEEDQGWCWSLYVGAYHDVSCWFHYSTLARARAAGRKWAKQHGFIVTKTTEPNAT